VPRGWCWCGAIIASRTGRARAGEVDLVRCDRDGTTVFSEVRVRSDSRFGGAAASVGAAKRQRLVFAAGRFRRRLANPSRRRFDVLAIDAERIEMAARRLRSGLAKIA
jgi:putative endonuclease